MLNRIIINSKTELNSLLISKAGEVAYDYYLQHPEYKRVTVSVWSNGRVGEAYMMAHSRGITIDSGSVQEIKYTDNPALNVHTSKIPTPKRWG